MKNKKLRNILYSSAIVIASTVGLTFTENEILRAIEGFIWCGSAFMLIYTFLHLNEKP